MENVLLKYFETLRDINLPYLYFKFGNNMVSVTMARNDY